MASTVKEYLNSDVGTGLLMTNSNSGRALNTERRERRKFRVVTDASGRNFLYEISDPFERQVKLAYVFGCVRKIDEDKAEIFVTLVTGALCGHVNKLIKGHEGEPVEILYARG